MNAVSFMGLFSAAPEGSLSHQLEILSLAVASPRCLEGHSRLSLPQELLPGEKMQIRGTK